MDQPRLTPIVRTNDRRPLVWIQIAPLALLVIVGATVIPVEFRTPSIQLISWSLNPRDFILNILLFLPLGVALSGHRRSTLVVMLIGLSLSIEIFQLAQAGRHAGPADLLANVLGGLLGSVLPPINSERIRIESGTIGMSRSLLIAIALFAGVAPLIALAIPREPHNFSNWDPTYRLAMGDEFTRDRSWRGSLAAWSLYDRALPRDSIRALAYRSDADDGPGRYRVPQDPVDSWRATDPSRPIGFLELSARTSTRIYQRLTRTNEMTLLAWIEVNDLDQVEDERILTLSHDQFLRNFSLTQMARTLSFRLRTPASGLNGLEPHAQTEKVLEPGQKYFVAATYDGFVSRIYVDGELVGRSNLAATDSIFLICDESTLPLILALCGGGFAALLILLFAGNRRSRRWVLACGGGIIASAFAWSLGGWTLQPSVNPLWRIVPPILGGCVVATSLTDRSSSKGSD